MGKKSFSIITFISGIILGISFSGLGYYFFLRKSEKNPITEKSNTLAVSDQENEKETDSKNPHGFIQNESEFPDDHKNDNLTTTQNDTIQSGDEMSDQDGFQLSQDEMIEARVLDAVLVNKKDAGEAIKDSLLIELQEAPKISGQKYRLEYWKSPVNFKGFKLIRNHLTTFGLDPSEPMAIFKKNDMVFLKYKNLVYKLYQTDDFKDFPDPVDESILN